uniref:Laminin IV type A domain-containing protein n=1 Tax=Steinernema glaseri TaxID=37863 RepID=A0A1I7ZBM9_9BILA
MSLIQKNVKGLKCDACDANSFSLEASNPLGCTDCFCFNRSNFCVQSNLVWQQVYADDRRIVFGEPAEIYSRRNNLNILKEYPLNYSSYLTDATPLYWPMPQKFLGDRTTSYNGYLRFKVLNDDRRRRMDNVLPDTNLFQIFPQVVIVGAYRKELRYVPKEVSVDGKYRVHLHESAWTSGKRPDLKVTRKDMMITLQNVQAIYVRATYIYPSPQSQASIAEVSLDIASFENTTDAGSQIAVGVEMCDACPQGYSGLSCQNAAEGYFRKLEPDYLNKPDEMVLNAAEGYFRKLEPDYLNKPDEMVLVGFSTPCACNGHSNTCDRETGSCTVGYSFVEHLTSNISGQNSEKKSEK